MPRDRVRALGFGLGAACAYGAFLLLGERFDDYRIDYAPLAQSRGEFALRLHLLLLVLPATILLGRAIAPWVRAPDLFDRLGRLTPRCATAAAAVAALLACALAALFRAHVLGYTAIVDDEQAYLFQARILATGRLVAPSPPESVRDFFDAAFTVNDGRRYAVYFIGHAVALALGLKAGLAEWIGPMQTALAVFLAAAVARRLLGPRAAVLTASLLALSPFLVFHGGTQLPQPTSTLALATLLYAWVRIEGSPRGLGWWALGGAAIGWGLLVRPQSMAFLALPVVVRLGAGLVRRRLCARPAAVAVMGALALAGVALLMWVNQARSGHPFWTGYHDDGAREWGRTGLGAVFYYPMGAGVFLADLASGLSDVNFWLFGWPLSLAFLPFFRRSGSSWMLLATAAAPFLVYPLFGRPSIRPLGPYYYVESCVPLAILTASGIETALGWIRARRADDMFTRTLTLWPATAAVFAILAFVPTQVTWLRPMAALARMPYEAVAEAGLRDAVVFVAAWPARGHAVVQWHRPPSPDLDDPVLFVHDRGPDRNRGLLRFLAGRKGYRLSVENGALVLARFPAEGR